MTTLSFLAMMLALGQTDAGEASLTALQTRAESTAVSLADAATQPRLLAAPVFRYSDQLRRIEDAGLWIWTVDGRPISALKIERFSPGALPKPWVYCIASLTTELITAEWKEHPAYRSTKPGITWQTLPDKPVSTRAARLIQMREIARRFSAELAGQSGTVLTEKHPMRLLPRPLYRYEDGPTSRDGALFAFTATGTNPDLLLLLDRPIDEGWQFGLACMTADGLTVKLGDQTVWDRPHTATQGQVFDNWAFYLHD